MATALEKVERIAQLVERLAGDQRVAGLSLTASTVTVLCPLARYFISCLVLVQPRKNHPDMTEKMLTGTLRIKLNELP